MYPFTSPLQQARTHEFHQQPRQIRRLALYTRVNTRLLRHDVCPQQADRARKRRGQVSNISASETLFRLGIAGQLVGQAGFIFVALALYDLLKGVNRRYASLIVALVVSRPDRLAE